MERALREAFGFEGTPVVFWFIDKNRKEYKKSEEGTENRE
jgi:predicted GTPase